LTQIANIYIKVQASSSIVHEWVVNLMCSMFLPPYKIIHQDHIDRMYLQRKNLTGKNVLMHCSTAGRLKI